MLSILTTIRRDFIPLAYLVAITVAEIIVVFGQPLWGIISHVLVLTSLLVHASIGFGYHGNKLLLGLTLAPLTRIISLAMPVQYFPQIYWFPLVYTPLLASAIVVMFNLHLLPGEIGLKWGRIPLQVPIILAGPFLGFVEYLILIPPGLVTYPLTWQKALLPSLIMIGTTGFVEELIFRGILQKLSHEILGSWGWLYVSILFAVLHIGFLTIADVLFVFAVAVLFSWVAKKSGSLLGVSLSHGLANVALYILVPSLLTI